MCETSKIRRVRNMKWLDDNHEMVFFSMERNVKYNLDGTKYREFRLYNVRSGNVFYGLNIYDDGSYEIETLDFFNDIKDDLYTLIMRDIDSENAYSYDKWILPLFRNSRIEKVLG